MISKAIVKICHQTFVEKYKAKLIKNDFAIISQNYAGVLYHDLGLQFQSPTINMSIDGESFVKLVENLPFHLKAKTFPITDCYYEEDRPEFRYPKIGVEDIEFRCIHYKNCNEAIEMWECRNNELI